MLEAKRSTWHLPFGCFSPHLGGELKALGEASGPQGVALADEAPGRVDNIPTPVGVITSVYESSSATHRAQPKGLWRSHLTNFLSHLGPEESSWSGELGSPSGA